MCRIYPELIRSIANLNVLENCESLYYKQIILIGRPVPAIYGCFELMDRDETQNESPSS